MLQAPTRDFCVWLRKYACCARGHTQMRVVFNTSVRPTHARIIPENITYFSAYQRVEFNHDAGAPFLLFH